MVLPEERGLRGRLDTAIEDRQLAQFGSIRASRGFARGVRF